jgi:hypothetical protein
VELNHRLPQNQRVSVNYTLLNGQETNQNRITTTDTITYNYLLKRPKHSLQLQYNVGYKKWVELFRQNNGRVRGPPRGNY